MTITLRRAAAADAPELGRICYEAFKAIAEEHNFPPDFPSAEVASGLLASLIAQPVSSRLSPRSTGGSSAATSWTSAIRSAA